MADAHGFTQGIEQPRATGAGLRTCVDVSVIHVLSSLAINCLSTLEGVTFTGGVRMTGMTKVIDGDAQ